MYLFLDPNGQGIPVFGRCPGVNVQQNIQYTRSSCLLLDHVDTIQQMLLVNYRCQVLLFVMGVMSIVRSSVCSKTLLFYDEFKCSTLRPAATDAGQFILLLKDLWPTRSKYTAVRPFLVDTWEKPVFSPWYASPSPSACYPTCHTPEFVTQCFHH